MVTQGLRHTPVGMDERELVDYLAEQAGAYRREAVVNYYVALKSTRFVILAGPDDVDKMRLAQEVAEALVGRSSLRWSCFQAHPWWATQTGAPDYFALAHARFNTLKLIDLIAMALGDEAQGTPFFAGIRRLSPAEMVCYFADLPRGYLWRADASTLRVRLPGNLFVTGTLDVGEDGEQDYLLDRDVRRHATIIRIGYDDLAFSGQPRRTPRPGIDCQRWFSQSAICRAEQARAKLAQILPGDVKPLAPLEALRNHPGIAGLPPFVFEQALLYLANAFSGDGQGLFVEPAIENLTVAQDHFFVQSVLPHMIAQGNVTPESWEETAASLAPQFPRASARLKRFLANSRSQKRPGPRAAGALTREWSGRTALP
jgi:hypothetical protein